MGIDLCEIDRIQRTLDRHGERFARRILGDNEQKIFAQRQQSSAQFAASFLAARFAAKEALGKALGIGIRDPMRWHRAQLLPSQNPANLGQPIFELEATLACWCDARHLTLHASITDTQHCAQAIVIACQR